MDMKGKKKRKRQQGKEENSTNIKDEKRKRKKKKQKVAEGTSIVRKERISDDPDTSRSKEKPRRVNQLGVVDSTVSTDKKRKKHQNQHEKEDDFIGAGKDDDNSKRDKKRKRKEDAMADGLESSLEGEDNMPCVMKEGIFDDPNNSLSKKKSRRVNQLGLTDSTDKKRGKHQHQQDREDNFSWAGKDANSAGDKRRKRKKDAMADGLKSSLKGEGKMSSVTKEGLSDDPNTSLLKKKSRRVSFSSNVEVFPPAQDTNKEETHGEEGLVEGKRFSLREDKLVKKAVLNYIKKKQLGDEGLDMILNFHKHPQVWRCWNQIGASLPWRPIKAVYDRAHILFERSKEHKWEPKEYHIPKRLKDIAWAAVSDKLATRYDASCCKKWYNKLCSRLASQGLWVDSDDYRMLDALQKLDACCLEDVDWDNILEHRFGEVCRERWRQMTRHLGEYREKPFVEQLDAFLKRYLPGMLEYRK